jgi:hypothetical protein
MRFAKWVFTGAGIYGFVAVGPLYFMEGAIGRTSAPISHPEYFYGFIGVTLAFQLLFLIIGRDPVRLRPAMIAAVAEKVSFPPAVYLLVAQGRTPPVIAGFATIDLILAVLFVLSWIRTRAL